MRWKTSCTRGLVRLNSNGENVSNLNGFDMTKTAFVQYENRWYAVPKSWAWNLSVSGFLVVDVPPIVDDPEEEAA